MSYYFLMAVPGGDYQLCSAVMPIQKNGIYEGNFIRGVRMKSGDVPEPVIIELRYPEDVMPEMFTTPFLLREDLLEDVFKFGVDNIDAYECHLINEETGKIWKNYKLCNIVGLIDVFDMEASELHEDSPPDTAYLFNEIVIDEKRCKGYHIFRPYGRPSEILVSEELKKYLEETGKCKNLEFVAPEDFA